MGAQSPSSNPVKQMWEQGNRGRGGFRHWYFSKSPSWFYCSASAWGPLRRSNVCSRGTSLPLPTLPGSPRDPWPWKLPGAAEYKGPRSHPSRSSQFSGTMTGRDQINELCVFSKKAQLSQKDVGRGDRVTRVGQGEVGQRDGSWSRPWRPGHMSLLGFH